MSGLTPDQVIELKHGLVGMAEVTRAFYDALRHEGFLHHDALHLTSAWMVAAMQGQGEDDE